MTQKPMIVLTGPTAVGKTALSIELAKKINGAIISADSMQVYKYMDIGSAKVTVDEMDGIKHYRQFYYKPSSERTYCENWYHRTFLCRALLS